MAATMRKKNGKYVVTIHHEGRRQQETFAHKRKAEAAAKRYNKLLLTGNFTIKSNQPDHYDTLNFYVVQWYEQIVLGAGNPEDQMARGTQDRYQSIWQKKLKNAIGKQDIRELTTSALHNYAMGLKKKGHTKSDISLRFTIIKGAMEQARLSDQVPANYADGILKNVFPKRRKKTEEQIKPFTDQEVELILSNARPQDYPVFLLLFTTGCRLGEVLGLNWDSVNFNEGYIVIQRSFRAGELSETTKTGMDREIPVSEDILAVLRELKLQHKKNSLRGFDSEAVFTRQGKRLCQNSFRNAWKRVLNRSELEYRKAHTIRHTVASRLLNEGHPVKLVAEILGHTIQTLLTTYSHILESDEDKKRTMLRGIQNAANRGEQKRPENSEEFPDLITMVPKARFELARP